MTIDRKSCGKMVELFVSLEILLWGLWVLSPFWDTFSSSAVFSGLKQVALEVVWGMVAAILGAIELILIHRGFQRVRQVITVINIFFFSLLAILYAIGNIQSTAALTYTIFAGMSLYSYISLTTVLSSKRERKI